MDQAIAVEWGRFLRELEARSNEALKNNGENISDGTAVENAGPSLDDPQQAVLQRLEDALAFAPAPEEHMGSNPVIPIAEEAGSDRPQDTAGAERSFMEQYARPPAENGRTSWPKASAGELSSALEPKRATSEEAPKYSMKSQWNGTTFEECRVLITSAPETPAAEPQPAAMQTTIQEDAAEQKVSSAPAESREGEMWKPLNRADSAVTEQPPSNAEPAHGQEASRWFMLKGMLGGAEAPEKTPDHGPAADVPVLEVFSLAGGVGKTSLVATLGRALSARGEHVLLVEATFLGSLQYFFGACDVRPGVVRTFRPPASSSDAPIRLATVDPDALLVESAVQGSLATDIQQWAQGASRVIVDVATGATAIARGMLQMSTVVLVPLIPDVHAIVTASSIDAFFQRNSGTPGEHSEVYYLLNQFDPSLPLHLDVREVLREKLGRRMLPFALPRTPAISEALAEGMTIIDYAPDSPATEDFISLAKWLDDVLAPADMNRRGMRWSER